MKPFLNVLGQVVDRIVWAVGCFTIISYALKHYPTALQIATVSFLVAFSIWYLWTFFFLPFRKALKDNESV